MQATSKGNHFILKMKTADLIARHVQVDYQMKLTFITPVSGRAENLNRFLENWSELVKDENNLNLIIAVGGNQSEVMG